MMPLLTFTWPDTALEIGAIMLVALILRIVLRYAIKVAVTASLAAADARRHAPDSGPASDLWRTLSGANDARHEARVRTLGSLLRNVVDVMLITISLLTILRIIGIPLEPILASAGIGGVALAFGAQSLVKDYITGIFMVFEDQFGVGDFIDTGEIQGTVEAVGLRVTRLRDANGELWYIRNGEILRIGNQSQGWSTGKVDIPIAYDEKVGKAIEVLQPVMATIHKDERWTDVLLEEPRVVGVNSVVNGAATIRVVAKCAPNQQWGVQRDILEQAVTALQAAGIHGPAFSLPSANPPA
ncbi:MAG: mechanosensitive ion channel family protein [Propioniciclava sp.]